MRINDRTGVVELFKVEEATLERALVLCRRLAKHADGDVLKIAERLWSGLADLKTALAEQGKEETVAAPY